MLGILQRQCQVSVALEVSNYMNFIITALVLFFQEKPEIIEDDLVAHPCQYHEA